jgi:multidrug efflux pump subunit AcrB
MEKLKPGFFSFWIENFKVSYLLFFMIVVMGLLSMITIPKESSPDIKFGIITITTVYPGVNPEDIDKSITEKIEKEISDIEGINKITSTSSVGVSSSVVELKNGVNTRDTLTDIKDRIDALSFPSDAQDPRVQEISSQNELMFQVSLYGDSQKYDTQSLMQFARKIQHELEGKYGIESMEIGWVSTDPFAASAGESEYDIEVKISRSKLESLGLSLGQIANTIRSFNANTPLGNFTIGDLNYDFRFEWELTDISALKNIVLKGNGVSLVRLGDISEITLNYDNSAQGSLGFYQASGYNYVTIAVNKKSGANIFKVSKSAKTALEEYLQEHSDFQELGIRYSMDLGETIIEDYKNLWGTAVQTFILVFLTIFIFVGLRESMIASILLPLAFFITFVVLNILGLSLNFLTNFSLVLTLGIAIDTIIVIIEGAAERQKLWFSRKNAVLLAMQDLKSPLISGTATTLCAFLPMIFLPGVIGRFLAYIPITVFSTLLAALILSLTLAWVLFASLARKTTSYYRDINYEKAFAKDESDFLAQERKWKNEISWESLNFREKFLSFLSEKYYRVLSRFLHNRVSRLSAIFLPFILLILSFILLAPQIGFTLFPASDEGIINIRIEAKTGTDEKVLWNYIPQVESVISQFEELKVYTVSVSRNQMNIYVELTDDQERKKLGQKDVFQIEEEIILGLDSLRSQWFLVEVATQANGPPTGAPVGIKLSVNSTSDLWILKQVADDFKAHLQGLEGTKNVSSSSSENPGQFVFRFDENALAFSGLTPSDILGPLRTNFAGISASSMQSEFEENDIMLSIAEYESELSPDDVENTLIPTKIGDVRVGDYARYSFEPSLSSISRLDGKINISVESEVENGYLPTDIQPKLIEFAQEYNFPDAVSYSAGGENSENAELIFATIQSFFIAIFLIFAILVFQFNSYSQPIMILYSVVLALLGVNIGLFLTGNPYSMTFGIGFIALTWVVVNDAIILVDRINRNLDRLNRNFDVSKLTHEDYVESLIAAGKSRLQPIIVTTITTVLWVLPLALQDAFWAGLGFTMIFGLFAGSSMTLFVVPAFYHLIYLKKKMRQGKEMQQKS